MEIKILNFLDFQERTKLKFIIFFGIILNLLEVIGVALIIPIFSIILKKNNFIIDVLDTYLSFKINNYSLDEQILFFSILILIFFFFKSAYLLTYNIFSNKFYFDIQKRLSEKLLRIYVGIPYIAFKDLDSAAVLRNLTTETAFFQKIINSIVTLIIDSFLIIVLFLLLALYSPQITILSFLVFFFISFCFHYLTKNINKKLGKSRQLNDRIKIRTILDIFGAIKEIYILRKINFFLNKFAQSNTQGAIVGRQQATLALLPRITLEMTFVITFFLIIFFFIKNNRSLDELLLLLALFTAASFRFIPSINRILVSSQTLKFASSSMSNLKKQLDLEALFVKKNNSNFIIYKKNKKSSVIKLRNVFFRYRNSKINLLNNINLTVKKGDVIAIIGKSGSGKSTLIDIILGLIEPNKGELLSFGSKIKSNLDSWHSKIGFIPQKNFIFSDTVKNNIALGVEDNQMSQQRLESSIKYAQLRNMISKLPKKYNFYISENGNNLSGGQSQRVGIARSLYNDPDILIFDEPTSALDMDTEKSFHNVLKSFKRNKTLIVCTHKLYALKFYDKVYELKDGKLKIISNV
jgi:ABC-type multidrug transport system fused ATPase/permease subunit